MTAYTGATSDPVRDLVLLFWGGEARRIGGPKRSVVSVHNVFIQKHNWTLEQNNNKREIYKTETAQTLTRKQTPTNQKWNPGYLSMILNQRPLTTPASDWEPC